MSLERPRAGSSMHTIERCGRVMPPSLFEKQPSVLNPELELFTAGCWKNTGVSFSPSSWYADDGGPSKRLDKQLQAPGVRGAAGKRCVCGYFFFFLPFRFLKHKQGIKLLIKKPSSWKTVVFTTSPPATNQAMTKLVCNANQFVDLPQNNFGRALPIFLQFGPRGV